MFGVGFEISMRASKSVWNYLKRDIHIGMGFDTKTRLRRWASPFSKEVSVSVWVLTLFSHRRSGIKLTQKRHPIWIGFWPRCINVGCVGFYFSKERSIFVWVMTSQKQRADTDPYNSKEVSILVWVLTCIGFGIFTALSSLKETSRFGAVFDLWSSS